jgi:cytochrome c
VPSDRLPFDPHDLRAMIAYLQWVADVNFPGHRGGKLVVRTGYGKAVIPVRPWAPPPAGASPGGARPPPTG